MQTFRHHCLKVRKNTLYIFLHYFTTLLVSCSWVKKLFARLLESLNINVSLGRAKTLSLNCWHLKSDSCRTVESITWPSGADHFTHRPTAHQPDCLQSRALSCMLARKSLYKMIRCALLAAPFALPVLTLIVFSCFGK